LPSVSFIVPAYNEERFLAPALESIHAAAKEVGESYEIVVANDASTDATPRIAEAAGARVVTVQNRQIAATRNAGARASTGDVLFFIDGDTRVNAALVKEALAALRAGAIGGGAPVTFYGDVPRWVHAFMLIFNPLYFGVGRWAAGCFIFCTRSAYEATGGFDETTYAGEEIGFSRSLKSVGRFVILRERVATSARKVEGRGFWEMMRITAGVARNAGFEGRLKRREDAGFWYEDRR
jgi:glycosyltransferase involved in cell wall biosynthesis